MKATDTWKTDGYVIGSPAYRMSISDTLDRQSVPIEGHQDSWVLINKYDLSNKTAVVTGGNSGIVSVGGNHQGSFHDPPLNSIIDPTSFW